MFQERQKTFIVSSEATIKVSDSTNFEVESVQLPRQTSTLSPVSETITFGKSSTKASSPELPILESVVVQAEKISTTSPPPEPDKRREQLMIDVEPAIQLAVTSPKKPAAALTPDFIEVRAEKVRKTFGENIVDRKLPSVPSNARKDNDVRFVFFSFDLNFIFQDTDPGQMYLKIRNNLKEVYTETIETKKAA